MNNLINEDNQNLDMEKKIGGKTFYTTRKEALNKRRLGDRIYYDATLKVYYIRRPVKRKFW